MLIQTLKSLFDRDLKRLRAEIEIYTNEQSLWHIEKISLTQLVTYAFI